VRCGRVGVLVHNWIPILQHDVSRLGIVIPDSVALEGKEGQSDTFRVIAPPKCHLLIGRGSIAYETDLEYKATRSRISLSAMMEMPTVNIAGELIVNGQTLAVGQVCGNRIVLQDRHHAPPTDAELIVTVDGRRKTYHIFLHHGISPESECVDFL
jgi:hypothetical protein